MILRHVIAHGKAQNWFAMAKEEVSRLCMQPIFDRGYRSGHVCGHSIGMTMMEMPRFLLQRIFNPADWSGLAERAAPAPKWPP